jgi:aminocarboxymuconate-semialdehyde decarboxylase
VPDQGAFDVHAHVMPLGRPRLCGTDDTVAEELPHAVDDGGGWGRIRVGGRDFRRVRSSLWDVADRLRELDASGIGHQAISPVPVALLDHSDPGLAEAFARWFNASLARTVSLGDGRLHGIGMLPLPHLDATRRELDRLSDDGIAAVEVGTRVGAFELDDPALRPFWAAAEERRTTVFVHPRDGGKGAVRRSGFLWEFGLGMVTDTAVAAGSLVFGGVLRDFPRLRVVLAHGCGTFARAYPRLRLGAALLDPALEDPDGLLRSLWVDTLVFDTDELLATIRRFGTDRVLVGSDHPFIDGQPAQSLAQLEVLAARGDLSAAHLAGISSRNAALLFGPRAPAAVAAGGSAARNER